MTRSSRDKWFRPREHPGPAEPYSDLDEGNTLHADQVQAIDYRSALLEATRDGAIDFEAVVALLSEAAAQTYRQSFGATRELLETRPNAVTYLFDATFAAAYHLPPRLIASWGRVRNPIAERDHNFMRGFPLPSTASLLDRGHVHARSLGGDEGIGINLIPQAREMNRGVGALGTRWRSLERAAATDRGAGLFTRCIYDDATDIPVRLEALLVATNGLVRLERLPNRPDAP